MTTHEERRAEVVRFYDELLMTKEGTEILGWSTKESQQIRFAALCGVADLDGRSVLDVGCGRGDLFGYLRDAGLRVDCRGVDIHEGLLDLARKTWPDGRFESRDILEGDAGKEADYVLCSGLFNLIESLPQGARPAFIRGDINFGSEGTMKEAEKRGVHYLFKLRQTTNVKRLVERLFRHGQCAR